MDNIRIQLNTRALLKELEVNWNKYLPELLILMRENCNRYVPKDRGDLIGSSFRASDLRHGKIIWDTPYARRRYFEGTPSKDANPNATTHWVEVATVRHRKEWHKAAREGIGTL